MNKLLIMSCLLFSSYSYAGMCTSEAISVRNKCTLNQFSNRCLAAKRDYRECTDILREYSKESKRKELDRKHRDFEKRNDRGGASLIEYIFGIRF